MRLIIWEKALDASPRHASYIPVHRAGVPEIIPTDHATWHQQPVNLATQPIDDHAIQDRGKQQPARDQVEAGVGNSHGRCIRHCKAQVGMQRLGRFDPVGQDVDAEEIPGGQSQFMEPAEKITPAAPEIEYAAGVEAGSEMTVEQLPEYRRTLSRHRDGPGIRGVALSLLSRNAIIVRIDAA
ncbi:MAG: hypothetical protein M3082_06335 [Candidatus Dormibacteraeota bacterium]|nr:hypothetical protein [Candidatus Dormibacteraeota bacterium]